MATRQEFAQAILQGGGWPVTQSNVNFLLAWMHREGGQAAFNPINTTRTAAGATDYNNVGVKNYTSMDQGVQAIVATLGGPYYGNIRAALTAGDASEADKAGQLAPDLHAWSAGPNAPMSRGYTSVTGGGAFNNIADLARETVSSVGSAVAGAAAAGANQAQQNGDIDGFLRSQAPELAKELSDPEVKTLLTQWGANQLTNQQFKDQLEKTNWWQTTPQSQRQLLVDNATDPATATQNLQNQMASVDKLGWQLGVHMQPQDVYDIALDSIKNGYEKDAARIQQAVAQKFNYNGQTLQGQAGTDLDSLNRLYKEYALPATQERLDQQLQLVLSGKQTVQDLQAQLSQQAQTLYAANPQLAQAIKSGMTVTQWADPYLQHAASILGLNANSISLTSPMWQRVLNPYTDPKTGQSTNQALTLDQWDKTLRIDPTYGYDNSQNAVNTASSFANQLVSKLTGAAV